MINKCISTGCPLFSDEIPVKLEKNNSKILLVFQAPGKIEWEKKAPIQKQQSKNSAGSRIYYSLERTGRKRKEFDITNAIQCYPKLNEKTKRDNKPNSFTKQCCFKNLETDIINNKYSKIICFGKIAAIQIDKIFGKIESKTEIIKVKHPCGGVSNKYLDQVWNL